MSFYATTGKGLDMTVENDELGESWQSWTATTRKL